MRFTVWCPVDGAVEVSADDVLTVTVRSGSDVEVAFNCPVCGAPIAVRALVPPGLMGLLGNAWGDPQSSHAEAWTSQAACGREADEAADRVATARIDAYIEYFRRELVVTDTVEAMLRFMDAGANR